MSNFVVSARKYRPARFDEVVGQQHISQTLKNALKQDRLAHAFLFCGPRGVGKTTNARILAKVLNCLQVTDDYEPCNSCANCLAFNQHASFNIIELDAASNNGVDHMHQLMEQVRIPPQSGRKKVYIIDEVHMLSSAAFNAFLKTLEEPPEYAVFILATTEKHKILPTILSRCQVYDFKRIRPVDIVQHLEGICRKEGISADKEALYLIAEKADGALRDALSVFDRLVSATTDKTLTFSHAAEQLNVLDYDTFFEVTDMLLCEDVTGLYVKVDQVLARGFEVGPFLTGLAQHIRQLFVCKSDRTLQLLEVSERLQQRYVQQAARCSTSFIVNSLNLLAECDFRIRQVSNKRLHLELYLVKLAFAQRTITRAGIATIPQGPVIMEAASPPTAPERLDTTRKNTPDQAANIQPNPTIIQTSSSDAKAATSVDSSPEQPPAPPSHAASREAPTRNEAEAANIQHTSSEEATASPTPAAELTSHPLTKTPPDPTEDPTAPQDGVTAVVSPDTANNSAYTSDATSGKDSLFGSVETIGASLSFEEEDEPEETACRSPEGITEDEVTDYWQKAINQQERGSVAAIMSKAKISYKAPVLLIRTGTKMAEQTLRSEVNELKDIKRALNCPDLQVKYQLDPEMAPVAETRTKVFSPLEQYRDFNERNPQLDALRVRLGLQLED